MSLKEKDSIGSTKQLNNDNYERKGALFKILQKARRRKRLVQVTTVLGCLVVFCTTYSLILPAITIDREEAQEMPGLKMEKVTKNDNIFENQNMSDSEINFELIKDGALLQIAPEEGAEETRIAVVVETDAKSENEASVFVLENDPESGVQITEVALDDPAVSMLTPKEAVQAEGLEDEVLSLVKTAEEEGILEPEEREALEEGVQESLTELGVSEDSSAAPQNDNEAQAPQNDNEEQAPQNDSNDYVILNEAKDLEEDSSAAPQNDNEEQAPRNDNEVPTNAAEAVTAGTNDIIDSILNGTILRQTVDGVTVTARWDEGVLPEGTEMRVKAVEAEEYKDLVDEALGTAEAETQSLDITFLNNGKEIEPNGDVHVTFRADFIESSVSPEVVHIKTDGTAEVMDTRVVNDEITLVTDQFSVYVIRYTVDFHWEANGQEYVYSFAGGSYIEMESLVEALGIGEGDASAFVAEIESMEFSDSDLVWVGKADEDTTVGELKDAKGLECEYSAELMEEQIAEINARAVAAGTWALISLKPFDTDETLTVTMKNGDTFTIKVTDAVYDANIINVNSLDGATGALVRTMNNLYSSVQSTAQNNSHLQALSVTIDSSTGSLSAANGATITQWTFEKVPNTQDRYYIKAGNSYLNIGNGSATVTSTPQALVVQTWDNKVRIKRTDNNYALNNDSNSTQNGYSAWDGSGEGYHNPGEWFTVYALNPAHATVHYVDREGNVLTGVQYTGGNTAVVANSDGTFTIPYDISGNIDLRANFNFDNVVKNGSDPAKYTYGSTHLAGDGDWSELTYEGYVIDSVLTASNGDLRYRSDSGETEGGQYGPDPGSLEYGSLKSYSLSGVANKRPSGQTGQVPYAQEVNKDIYVILDPLPGPTAASPSGGPGIDAAAPDLTKTMVPNNDGTYTLSLKVDAHGNNLTETNKANILFVVDTSSSMRNPTEDHKNRIIDTHDAVLDLGDRLLAYNNSHPEAVEVAMLAFDGDVYERLDWTDNKQTFDSTVNEYLRYYWMHQGTDWEDALKETLAKLNDEGTDDDPTFVVFFTDGEPSNYTSFHGAGENKKTDYGDPLNNNSFSHDWEEGKFSYPNYYSYFLSRESSKDELRAIVDTGVQLYGIYAYNSTNQSYNGYNGPEDGAKMLHNAIKYGYNTDADLKGNLFYEAKNTNDLKGAFDKIFNSITEKVGFSNVVVEDGISAGVTSTTVLEGDVSAFTYIIRDNKGAVAYKVTVAPNGVPDGQTAADGTPVFTIGSGPPVIGQKKTVSTTKIKKDAGGNPILDGDGHFQTEAVDVEVYYYKDANDKEYIMPISTTGEHVSWDLSPLGLLKDGYSYEVNFVVWPNQESYDLVADLNNGKRPDIEASANWENCPIKTDSAGRQYRQGGFPDYPYISRYEDNGVYSAMSNTEQKVDYYKIDKKIVNGEETTVITHGSKDVPPPNPMPLTASYSRIEKLWNVERDPGIFAQYLYNTDGSSKGFNVDFDVFQGNNLTNAYTSESVGWVYDLDGHGDPVYLGENDSGDYVWEKDPETGEETGRKLKGHYVWAPGDTMKNVTYAGHAHSIGTRWVTDFSIATGLMLTTGEMERLGLNKSLYTSAELEGVTYYILEPGHDYTIKEKGENIGYEFDFKAPVYHPMLVDGVLKNVEITYTYKPDSDDPDKQVIDTATISSITGSSEGLSGLEVENTLRGYINLNKVVVDENNQKVESDNTKFEYTIKLDAPTSPGPFVGTHIPWYGVNGLFYNDGIKTYYQVYEAQGGVWMIRNEAGKEYPVTSTGFDPDEAGAQTVHYTVNGQPKEITLFGNQMTPSNNGVHAEAKLAITQNETLYIANVPVGTTYTITETNTDDYTLIDILKEVRNGTAVEQSEHVTDLSNRETIGTIVTNRDNHVTYTNKVLTGGLKITKEIRKNGTTDTSATGRFYYAVYDEPYDSNADPAQDPVRTGHIDVTANGTGEITESDLKIGSYYVYELTGEGGTPVTDGGLYNGGKYFTVTTEGSPATITLGSTSTAGIINNYETIPVTATKSWADNNPEHLTVYFKLFYKNAAGVDVTTGTPLKELPYNVTSVTWDDLPKYDENGQLYNYIVREYVLDEANGEFTEGGHKYTEAAPSGYVNTEAGLTVTNSKLETYDPETTYSGIKLWEDTVNGSKTRPDSLNVTLMIDKAPFDNPAGDTEALDDNGQPYQMAWVTIDEDEWKYTFHNLPMFDENKQIINYYAVETPVNGYEGSVNGSRINTKYEYKSYTLDHTENDAYPVMSSDADLVYCAVRIQHEGYLHHIWTQRVPTDEEKTRLVGLVNEDLAARNLPADATVNNVRWVNGLPINHEFVWKAQPNGYKVSFTRFNTNTIHVKVDNHGAFSNICYGTLQYNYTAGSTDFKNELQPTTYTVEKTWGDDVTPPEGAVAVIELQGTVQRPVDPQPVGATEIQYQTVSVDLAAVGVTQKIRVTLNGGKAGGDDTAQDPWKYSWENLPQYNKEPDNKDPLEITYSVKEISYTIGGHTVNLTDFAPEEDDSIAGTTKLTNRIPSYSFEILKIDAVSADPLPGAEFTVKAIAPTSNTVDPTVIGNATVSTPIRTGTDGKVSFNNIPYGYYEVEETHMPDGYIRTEDGKFYIRVDTDGVKLLEKVIADGDTQPKLSFREVLAGSSGIIRLGNVQLTTSGNVITLTVENTPGTELPSTGGPGAEACLAMGALMAVGAGAVLIRRKLRRQ